MRNFIYTSKNIFILFVFILGFAGSLEAQVNKTLVKSLAVKTSTGETNTAMVDLPGVVEVVEWENDFVRITTNLTVQNMSENIVKQLVTVGRYTLVSNLNQDNQTLSIEMPKVANHVSVRGVQVSEVMTFEISVPKGYKVIVKDSSQEKESLDLLGQSL